MAVSCADMVLPGVQLLDAPAWTALLVGAALLVLLDGKHRMPAAHHAASLLAGLMALPVAASVALALTLMAAGMFLPLTGR